MPKRRPPKRTADELARLLGPLVARLERCEAVLNQLELDLRPTQDLPGSVLRCRELAQEALAQAQDALETSQLARVHEDRLNTLTLAVAEGIQHVERAEARIRATVGRARAELRAAGIESPAIEAEAGSLHIGDGEGGAGGAVLPVPTRVEAPVSAIEDRQPSAVPGMTVGQLRRFRGA